MNEQPRPTRPRAEVIYERVREDARDQLERPGWALAFSGLFAGFTIGATPLAVAASLHVMRGGAAEDFAAEFLYPIGFAAVILGRAQLFTENTLYPVVASLEDRRAIPGTARLWGIVFATNLLGALLFALVAVKTSALSPGLVEAFRHLGEEEVEGSFGRTFWAAVLSGWLLALVAWLIESAEAAIGQLFIVWALTLLVGLASLDHSVASSVEVLGATMEGDIELGKMLGWLAAATLGNVVGGVLIVSALNYGQVRTKS